MGWIIIGGAVLLAAWGTWPPRGEERGWLLTALLVLWASFIGEGVRRGVLPEFRLWLVVLALIGALVALLVIWSATNLVARREQKGTVPPRDDESHL